MDAANDYDSDFETPLGYVGKSTGPGQVYFDVMKTDEHPDISADRVMFCFKKHPLMKY